MQHYIPERRHHGDNTHSGYHSSLSHFEFGSAHLVHQELEELRTFAPLTRKNLVARQSGTRVQTAVRKLSTLVRYAYLSLF